MNPPPYPGSWPEFLVPPWGLLKYKWTRIVRILITKTWDKFCWATSTWKPCLMLMGKNGDRSVNNIKSWVAIHASLFKLWHHMIMLNFEFPNAEIHCSSFPPHWQTASSLDEQPPPSHDGWPPPSLNEWHSMNGLLLPSMIGLLIPLTNGLFPCSTNGLLPCSMNGLFPCSTNGLLPHLMSLARWTAPSLTQPMPIWTNSLLSLANSLLLPSTNSLFPSVRRFSPMDWKNP